MYLTCFTRLAPFFSLFNAIKCTIGLKHHELLLQNPTMLNLDAPLGLFQSQVLNVTKYSTYFKYCCCLFISSGKRKESMTPKSIPYIVLLQWHSQSAILLNSGGVLTCQRYTGMCRFDNPHFRLRSSATPETHLFTPSVSSYALHFHLLKNSTFLGSFFSDFSKISAPNTLIWAKICSLDPSFLTKKYVL